MKGEILQNVLKKIESKTLMNRSVERTSQSANSLNFKLIESLLSLCDQELMYNITMKGTSVHFTNAGETLRTLLTLRKLHQVFGTVQGLS